MRAGLREVILQWAILMSWFTLTTGVAWPQTPGAAAVDKGASKPPQTWAKLAVDLPASQRLFPARTGSDIANGQCLICHSAGMVLSQPPLTEDEWRAEVNKMRNTFGAPLPADQVDPLVQYLYSINGARRPADGAASGEPGK